MVLFAIQLVRVVINSLLEFQAGPIHQGTLIAFNIVMSIHAMLNVII